MAGATFLTFYATKVKLLLYSKQLTFLLANAPSMNAKTNKLKVMTFRKSQIQHRRCYQYCNPGWNAMEPGATNGT